MLKIAIIQFKPILGQIADNIQVIGSLVESAPHAQLLVLPELASTGYNFSDRDQAYGLAEEPAESTYLNMLVKYASRNGQYFVTGFNEKAKEGIFNSSALIGPEGIIGIYRKMHLFMHEKEYFLPGDNELKVFDTTFGKIGMQICFDYLFPEPWRILAEQDAYLIVHPSNLLTQNATKALPGIAMMNRVFIVSVNRIGTEGELTFNGGSMIIDPSGNILKKASADQQEIIEYDLDISLSADKMITPLNHVFRDRRPEQYK
jgi:predicted amidohydrolase